MINKEQIIEAIEQRINAEYKKHSHTNDSWAKIAAIKIYSTYLKESII